MQFLSISKNTSLMSLSNKVGTRNVDSVLNTNSLSRRPDIGKAFSELCQNIIDNTTNVSNQRKSTILNTLTSDSDVFETASLLNENGWKLLSNLGTLPHMLRIPETIRIPQSELLLGNNEQVSRSIYDKAISQIQETGSVDPAVFNKYSNPGTTMGIDSRSNPISWFNLPWGKITLHSSLSDISKDFPVFPEELDDGVVANYEQMPELLYQYEPWQVYRGSGPRTNTFTFHMHRDMWTGDHRDGKCNELIRFCEANCYPKYLGASVQTATVTLYIAGKPYISGILTDVKLQWSGPIGLDDFHLECKLQITITEVSKIPLNYDTVMQKGLI